MCYESGNRVHASIVLDLRINKNGAGNEQDSIRVQPFGVRDAVKELTFSEPLNFTQKEWAVAAEIKDILSRKARREKEWRQPYGKGGEFFVFMWRHHFPKLQISNPTVVLVSSDIRPYQNLAFYDV